MREDMKARQLTENEVARLRPQEEAMRCAMQGRWMRWPGMDAVKEALDVWQAAYGAVYRLNTGCSRCVLNMYTDLARLYFPRAEELAAARKRRARR